MVKQTDINDVTIYSLYTCTIYINIASLLTFDGTVRYIISSVGNNDFTCELKVHLIFS